MLPVLYAVVKKSEKWWEVLCFELCFSEHFSDCVLPIPAYTKQAHMFAISWTFFFFTHFRQYDADLGIHELTKGKTFIGFPVLLKYHRYPNHNIQHSIWYTCRCITWISLIFSFLRTVLFMSDILHCPICFSTTGAATKTLET